MRDDLCTHLPPQIAEEALFPTHSPLFYNVSKLPENCTKKTIKSMRGPGPESCVTMKFFVFPGSFLLAVYNQDLKHPNHITSALATY